MSRRVTLQEIAQIAHVHVTTVSLALRNHPRIPERTRNRIKKISKHLGYQPDPALSALVAYRQSKNTAFNASTIAYLTGEKERNSWKKFPSVVELVDGAQDRAKEFGYRLEEFWIHEPNMTRRRWNQLFLARGIRALLIAPWFSGKENLQLDWGKFYCAKIGYSTFHPDVHTVENNQYQCMRLAMQKVLKKGYKKIGFVHKIEDEERLRQFYKAAYLIEQEELAVENRLPPCILSTWRRDEFARWYERYQPDAVISPDSDVYQWMRALKLAIPQDVAFISLDCSGNNCFYSGIHQPHYQVGEAAVDLIVGLIHRNEYGIPSHSQQIQIRGRWVDGKTSR